MQTTLFDIATREPRVDMFMAYLSGRLDDNNEISQLLVDYYNEWTEFFGTVGVGND